MTLRETVLALRALLIRRVTGGGKDYEESKRYQKLWSDLEGDPAVRPHLPSFEWTGLEEHASEVMKAATDFSARAQFIERAFEPLLAWIDQQIPPAPEDALAERLAAQLTNYFMHEGYALGVAVLTSASKLRVFDDVDGYNNDFTVFSIGLPPQFYTTYDDSEREAIHQRIREAVWKIGPERPINAVRIDLDAPPLDNWKAQGTAWLRGEGINNQGKVRSDNRASRQEDGLLFRSTPEIHVYRALKATGVVFAPLPVFLHGGAEYRRVEPDFIAFRNGRTLLLEVDGDNVHRESPADADERTKMFKRENVYCHHVKASDCDTPDKAKKMVADVLRDFDTWCKSR